MDDRRMGDNEKASGPNPGLCGRCVAAQRVTSSRGSVFWLCGRAATDSRFPRYPALPVLHCEGYEPAATN